MVDQTKIISREEVVEELRRAFESEDNAKFEEVLGATTGSLEGYLVLPSGWKKHTTQERPADIRGGGTMVRAMMRCLESYADPAEYFTWSTDGGERDIIAYKVLD